MDSKNILRGEIKSADDKDPAGAFVAVLSAPTLDRDGEIIDAGAFEPLPEHIPIDVDHGMDTRSTVGSGRPYYDGDLLMFEGRFASTPLGQETRTLVTEGHVRKMSVAFMGAQREEDEDGVVHIRSGELLNAAVVSIPSNRDADILAAKAFEQARDKRAEVGRSISRGVAEGISKTPMTFSLTAPPVADIGGQVESILRREAAFAGATESATAVEDEKAAAPAPARRPAALAVAKALAEAAPLLP
jgi:HK97 family phage prohead protease